MIQIAFWVSVLLVLYPLCIYPVAVLIIGAIRPRAVQRAPWQPAVTVLIPAFNEVECIAATVQNKLDQVYPAGRLQIIVVSDGSTDGTDAVVTGFAERGVQLIRREGREGKAAALNEAVRHAKGDIVVFSDANSIFAPDAIASMVANFHDPSVGYMTGSLRFQEKGSGLSEAGIGAYMRYENLVRRLETRVGSVIGVNGGVDAIRRSLYSDIPRELITDFVLPLRVIAAGYRVVFDPSVVSTEWANDEVASEFRMRVRVALRALHGMMHMRELLNPLRHPLTAFCLISHKLLRYLGFAFMAIALLCNIWLALSSALYASVLCLHLACYLLALAGLARELPAGLRRLSTVPSYVLVSYAAFGLAVLRFLRGQKMATWQPRAG